MLVSPISKINTYSNQNKKINFQSTDEQKIFMETFEKVRELKLAMQRAAKSKSRTPIANLFSDTFVELKRKFLGLDLNGFLVDKRGYKLMRFKDKEGRPICIEYINAPDGVSLNYNEFQAESHCASGHIPGITEQISYRRQGPNVEKTLSHSEYNRGIQNLQANAVDEYLLSSDAMSFEKRHETNQSALAKVY